VKLALSLHGASQEVRQALIPSAAPFAELDEAIDYHIATLHMHMSNVMSY